MGDGSDEFVVFSYRLFKSAHVKVSSLLLSLLCDFWVLLKVTHQCKNLKSLSYKDGSSSSSSSDLVLAFSPSLSGNEGITLEEKGKKINTNILNYWLHDRYGILFLRKMEDSCFALPLLHFE